MRRPVAARDSWRAFVTVAQIPDTGLHRDIAADPTTREAMAVIAGLRDISSARASFDLMPQSGGQVHVTGRVEARIGQTCVVTLEPIESEIDEAVDLIFAPATQIAHLVDAADDAAEGEGNAEEPPEPFENGIIDLGRLATDVLYLAVDPYPRKPGVVFQPQVAAHDPEDHPFAALRALQPGSAGPKSSNSEGE
jgi:hypothetical protein